MSERYQVIYPKDKVLPRNSDSNRPVFRPTRMCILPYRKLQCSILYQYHPDLSSSLPTILSFFFHRQADSYSNKYSNTANTNPPNPMPPLTPLTTAAPAVEVVLALVDAAATETMFDARVVDTARKY